MKYAISYKSVFVLIPILLGVSMFFACTKKAHTSKPPKKKKSKTAVIGDQNKIRVMIINNMQPNSDGSVTSFITDTITGTRCVLKFPANCFEIAKKEGYTIQDVVDSCENRVFSVLYSMVTDLRCTYIEFSSLWRPYTPGNPNSPHNTGRGIDITRMKSKYGDVYFNISTGSAESAYVKLIRNWCYPTNKNITQYFSPWQMCNEKSSCNGACCSNDKTAPNHKLHLNHLHLTIRADE